jgi:hypothetical protein
VQALAEDVQALKSDMAAIKSRITELQATVAELSAQAVRNEHALMLAQVPYKLDDIVAKYVFEDYLHIPLFEISRVRTETQRPLPKPEPELSSVPELPEPAGTPEPKYGQMQRVCHHFRLRCVLFT